MQQHAGGPTAYSQTQHTNKANGTTPTKPTVQHPQQQTSPIPTPNRQHTRADKQTHIHNSHRSRSRGNDRRRRVDQEDSKHQLLTNRGRRRRGWHRLQMLLAHNTAHHTQQEVQRQLRQASVVARTHSTQNWVRDSRSNRYSGHRLGGPGRTSRHTRRGRHSTARNGTTARRRNDGTKEHTRGGSGNSRKRNQRRRSNGGTDSRGG